MVAWLRSPRKAAHVQAASRARSKARAGTRVRARLAPPYSPPSPAICAQLGGLLGGARESCLQETSHTLRISACGPDTMSPLLSQPFGISLAPQGARGEDRVPNPLPLPGLGLTSLLKRGGDLTSAGADQKVFSTNMLHPLYCPTIPLCVASTVYFLCYI